MAKPLANLTSPELRAAWYHRLHFLWPLLARRGVRTALRGLGWSLLGLYFIFVALVLVLRYGVLPEIHRYQPEIEAAASKALGQPVSVGHLQARWDGLNPALVLEDVRLLDAQGNPALTLTQVQGVLSWQTLVRGQPHFALLALERPALQVRRAASGEIFVAGISSSGDGDPRALQWVLDQSRIRIQDATIVWEDELRQAPPLVLEDLQFELTNWGSRHRFGLTGVPPAELASRLDLRGDLHGDAADALEDWEGTLYTRLDYADLAGWKAWMDYPVDLPQGRGGLQLWAGREDGVWKGTADLALQDLRIRLGRELPELDVKSLSGRVELSQAPGFLHLKTRQLQLDTSSGVQVSPLNLAAEWRGEAGQPGRGSLTANVFDLQALATLAAYLPLDATSRALLERHQPQGLVKQLQMSWDARDGVWKKYQFKAGFEGLGLLAHGVLPGAQGLVGRLEANEKEGSLQLDSRKSSLSLPAIFAEPDTPLERLVARVNWQPEENGVAVQIERLDFSGPYATGQVSGTYHKGAEGPGVIDLTGGISQAKATEVWRYIPKAVNADVPAWLRQGLLAGTGGDAKLTLRGDLKDFPFRDPATGLFLITAKARDVTIHYGQGWPVIEAVNADMSFGVGMKIQAQSGHILGAKLGPVTVSLPDFDVPEELLLVDGRAAGPTAEFLKFIAQSPVSDTIDNFSESMTAQGSGRLELSLELPLRHIDDARIKGLYHFENNQIGFVPGMPPATGVNGRLEFTEGSVSAPEIRGQFLGQPMKLAALSADGAVNIKASGGFTARELRKQLDIALFDHLAGAAPWQAEVKVRKKNADFQVTSSLQGLSSSLPPPFNKTASDALPFRLQKSALESRGSVAREQVLLSLGKVAEGQLIRQQGGTSVLERGSIGVGEPARLPDKGLAVFITQDKLDLDLWRKLLEKNGANGNGSKAPALPLNLVALQTQELTAFGRSFGEVSLRLRPDGTGWRALLAAREAVGELFWDGAGHGTVGADLKRLRLESGKESAAPDQTLLQSLPGMDIRVEDFSVGQRRLGRLELKAENVGGRWNLRQILIDNPDGQLTGTGVWEIGGANRTLLDFKLNSSDTGGLLARLGYPGAVKGGTTKLAGKLDWAGSPVAFDPASLGGSLQLEAAKGQFSKVEPGVGKLLGLLSLQSITRRLTLDFRDIFSDGFAYDSIEAKMNLKNGVMQTDGPLKIDGPAGEVLMTGRVDMKQETQNLLVTVQPEVGGVAAVGAAMVINPVVGAAALLAQNLFQNPLNKAFGFQYKVTGSWTQPQVLKVTSAPVNGQEAAQ